MPSEGMGCEGSINQTKKFFQKMHDVFLKLAGKDNP
jgi:hypothetical protein